MIKKSIEVNNSFTDGEGTVLFAYKIGCIGGIDPITVKYFAYKNGVKHALRGEEHIIVANDGYGGENPPIPDHNLKNDKPLLNYMLKKMEGYFNNKNKLTQLLFIKRAVIYLNVGFNGVVMQWV